MTTFAQLLHPRDEQPKNYLSPRGGQALAASIIFTSLATITVAARVYTRTKLIKRIEANDWMIIIALVFSFVFMAFFVVEALNGIGMHYVDIPAPIFFNQMKAFWITIPFYNAALLCAKASILLQYFRVFPSKNMRHTCWVMLVILATYGTWAVLSAFLNCIPVAKFWDDSIPGSCLSSTGLWFSNAAMHIATDLVILVIPIPALSKLELPKKQRVALISIFALGGFVCITSICRLVSLKKISDSSDPTYDNVGAATWSAIECNVGIICACLPTLRPLISRLIPQLLSLTSSRRLRSRTGRSKSKPGFTPDAASQATYWGFPGGVGVSTTITTHIDDLEYGSCEGDKNKLFALRYGCGYGFGAGGVGVAAGGIARTQARVYVGSDQGDVDVFGDEHEHDNQNQKGNGKSGSRGKDKSSERERERERERDVVPIVRTEVRTGSSSGSPLVGKGDGR